MAFKLSQRSLDKLNGVHPDMVAVVKRAIELTDVDFGVTYGVRTLAEQEELYNSGRSQTMYACDKWVFSSPFNHEREQHNQHYDAHHSTAAN